MKAKRLSTKRGIRTLAGVAVIVAIIYLAYLSHKEFEDTMVSQTQQQLLTIAKTTARGLEESIAHHSEALQAFSKNPLFQEQNQQYRLLKSLHETHKEDVDAIYLLDPNGIVLYRHPSKEGGKDRVGVSLSDRPGVSYVLKERKPYVSEVFHNKLGELTISISEPIFYEDKFTGIVRWMISMDTLSEHFILPVKVGEKWYAWLLDDHRTMLAHPKAEHVGKDIMASRKERFPDYDWSELEDVVEKMTKGEEGVGIYHSAWWIEEGFETLKKLTAYAPVHIGNELWSIGVSMSYSEITGPINENARNTFGLTGLVILLFGAGGVVLFRTRKKKTKLETEAKYLKEISKSAEKLRESEGRYRSLVDNISLGINLIDPDYNIVMVNTVQGKKFNKRTCEFVGKKCFREFEKKDAICPHCPGVRAMAKGHRVEVETEGILDDGSRFNVRIHAFPCFGQDGTTEGFIEVVEDITESKRAEEEKEKLRAQLAHAQRMEAIGTLAGGIAHNFNNLLMGIQGNASLMLLEADPAHPNYERLRNIEKSLENGSRLTRQLLGYAREEEYKIGPISLNQLVEESSKTFGTTKKEIRVHRELAEDLCGIEADQGQIEQVLLNLYVNASDAMPNGGDLFLNTMNVTHKDMRSKPYEVKPGKYVLLTVRDTGVGMDKKTMEHIFDPFFTTKGLARGTGLGLASVYGTVKGHGGYIDVESKKGHARPASEFQFPISEVRNADTGIPENSETRLSPPATARHERAGETDPPASRCEALRAGGGQGTTFSIYLPASERKVEEAVKSSEQIVEGGETILLVDDEEMVLDVGVQLLKALGYTVLEAKRGREAVEIYRERKDKIDMVLLDMIMPDMGGGEAYDRMKEINPDIKVLLSSGYSIDGQATEILERGCNGFIQKSFNMKELSRSIREILDKE